MGLILKVTFCLRTAIKAVEGDDSGSRHLAVNAQT